MAPTMLDEHRTLRRYSDEAMNTTFHVGNQIFLRAFLNKTCYEFMHGRAPRVSHFKDMVVGASFPRTVGLISLSRGLPMGFLGLC
jgi:hypothetical protein